MTKKIVLYQCDYCNYRHTDKYRVERHEEICCRRPDAKPTAYTKEDNENNGIPRFLDKETNYG